MESTFLTTSRNLQGEVLPLSSAVVTSGKAKESSRSLPLFCDDEGELCTLGARIGQMECMPLRSPPGPYHYHVTDQTKSLQELQNEVGALLEFRDLVIETFPDLKHKMASSSASSTITGLPSSSLASRRTEWEPGIRVRRKLTQKENAEMSSSSLIRSRSNSHSGKKEPKSGEGNGSVVQDSGFSTETSSSKETHSASSTNGAMQGVNVSNTSQRMTIDSDNELWNLLDVLHRKSNRLRDEVEHLQQLEKERCKTSSIPANFQKQLDRMGKEDVQLLRKERDRLLDKLAEMEAENLSGRIRATNMEDQISALNLAKQELEEQLKHALNQKIELNSRVKELQQHFEATKLTRTARKFSTEGSSSSSSTQHHGASIAAVAGKRSDAGTILGRLDGLVSTPNRLNKVRLADSKKIEAILLENNVVELQRHLLTLTVQNQVLQQKLDQATRSKIHMIKLLDKAKEEIDDLKFQLEERNIEFEGTKAQLRVLESKSTSRLDHSSDTRPAFKLSPSKDSLIRQSQISTPSMKAMVPLAMDEVLHHSSSTESAQDQCEQSRMLPETPKKRPSRIPLAGMKGIASPKPPTGRSINGNNGKLSPSGPPSNRILNKSTSSLLARSGPSSVKKDNNNSSPSLNRPDSAQSWRKDTSLTTNSRSSSIPISAKSTPSPVKPLHSPLPKAKRDTVTAKTRNLDSLNGKTPPVSNVITPTTSPGGYSHGGYKSKKDFGATYQARTKPSSVPVRRISNSSTGSRNGDSQDYENGKLKLSKSTENVAERVEQRERRGSRDLIREYLMRTRVQPPAIFQTPFETFTSPMPNMELAYRYPHILDDETGSVHSQKNRDMEIKYYDDNYSIELLNSQSKSEDENSANKSVIHRSKSSEEAADEVVKSTRIEGTCRLIGKVNPNILKTWEQLKSGTGPLVDGPMPRVFYKKQSSNTFYDSIDNSIGTVTSDTDEGPIPAAGEVMAECDSLLDKKPSSCWSIESDNKYIIS
ncbi:Pyruvate kinase [Sergentomyia squamirostris]